MNPLSGMDNEAPSSLPVCCLGGVIVKLFSEPKPALGLFG
jgi:hypothetical protein